MKTKQSCNDSIVLELLPKNLDIISDGLKEYCEYNQRCARPPIYPVIEKSVDIWEINFCK